jgi:hypothetical protein
LLYVLLGRHSFLAAINALDANGTSSFIPKSLTAFSTFLHV